MTVARARSLRSRTISSEQALWSMLRRRQLFGLRFRRQFPIGPFIVDFICLERRLIVEVDGGVHETVRRQHADIERDRWLVGQRFKVLRIPGGIASEDPDRVRDLIAQALGTETVDGAVTPHPRPFPRKGGRGKEYVACKPRDHH